MYFLSCEEIKTFIIIHHQKIEINRERIKIIEANKKVISFLHHRIDPREVAINQKQIISTRTRLNVTTCLYLSPNTMARSLSTLIPADVKRDTAHKVQLKAFTTFLLITVIRDRRNVA